VLDDTAQRQERVLFLATLAVSRAALELVLGSRRHRNAHEKNERRNWLQCHVECCNDTQNEPLSSL